MKFEKKIIALLLALFLLLTGCGNGQLSATDDTTAGGTENTTGNHFGTDETTESTKPDFTVNCQYLPQSVENPDDLPVLKWVCLADEIQRNRVWNEAAAIELNQMLSDRDMPFRVQFVLLTPIGWIDGVETQLWYDSPEALAALAEADLIYGAMNEKIMVQYLSPITEYVTGTAEPSLKNAVAHEYNWLSGTVDGEIYGYNTRTIGGRSWGWRIEPALLQAAGLKAEDLQREFWDMDAVLAKLYAANGEEPFLYIPTYGRCQGISSIRDEPPTLDISSITNSLPKDYAQLSGFFAIDYSQETPVVINWLETEMTRKKMEAVLRYSIAGYVVGDVDDVIRMMATSPLGEDICDDKDGFIRVPVTNAYFTTTAPEGFISGVAAVSEHKDAAISLLNLIAEDEAFRMQLFYGKEGRDYKITDGYYEMIKQEDGSNYSLDFLSPLAYFCGMTKGDETFSYTVATSNDWYAKEGKTELQTYQEILDESTCYYPIVFDYSGIEQEMAAMAEVFNKKYSVLAGSPLTEEIRQMLIKDLKAAGSDKVLAELQRQLAEWQRNNPDWTGKTAG